MKKLRFFSAALCILLVLSLLAACAAQAPAQTPPQETASSEAPAKTPAQDTPPAEAEAPAEEEAPVLNVAALKGPTGMGMVKLMQDSADGKLDYPFSFVIESAPDVLSGKLVTGEVDIAALPINLAAALYNKTQGEIVMIAVNTLGVLYVLENGDTINSVSDLSGKTLYATGQGSTPEFILNHLLEQNGVNKKVEVEYKAEHAELATLLGAGEVKLGMLPEPNVTAVMLKNDKLRIALDLTEEWAKIHPTPLIQGCIVARREALLDYPEVIHFFLEAYEQSTAFTVTEAEEAAKLIEQYEIMGSAAAAQKAIPKCNIVYMDGADMRLAASAMLEVLFEAEPKSIGGQMPNIDFYHIKNAG